MPKKIFILEDDDDLRELYELILEGEDYLLSCFATVGAFMQEVEEIPDLYLLDVMLPDGDGKEVCKHLKNGKRTSHIPVIMVSAHSDISEIAHSCPKALFLAKPFDIEQLSRQVALMLQGGN